MWADGSRPHHRHCCCDCHRVGVSIIIVVLDVDPGCLQGVAHVSGLSWWSTQVAWCTGGGWGCMWQHRRPDWGHTQFTLVECPGSGIVVGIVDGPTSRAPLSGSIGVVMVRVRHSRAITWSCVVIAVVAVQARVGGAPHLAASLVSLWLGSCGLCLALVKHQAAASSWLLF